MHLLQTRSLTSKLWFKQSKLVKINLLFAPRFSITSNQSVIWFFVRFLLLHNKMHWTEPTRVQISLDTKKHVITDDDELTTLKDFRQHSTTPDDITVCNEATSHQIPQFNSTQAMYIYFKWELHSSFVCLLRYSHK